MTELRFKPGDVIRYNTSGEAIIESVESDHYILLAWRDNASPEKWVCMKNGILHFTNKLRPHPEADRVLAEFTAWRLTQ